ncbi:MAG TPA: hypothetical protein VL442_09630 [Mucilaginibacter sp.]|jgi:hypothetical protein|nr:hypothetical protein [Mucilaginibacter sp.]
MKKIICLFILTVVSASLAFSQTAWVTHKADDKVSVKFPNAPKEVIPGTFISIEKVGKDSVGYALTVVDFVKVAGIDSAALAPIKATPEFASQLKTGMTQSLPGVELEDFKISTWKGYTSYTSTGNSPSKKQKMYIFMVLIGTKMYSLAAMVPDGAANTGRDQFFSSLTLTN